MAKKFGKFILFTAAVGTAAAAAYYFMQKKDSAMAESQNNDDDYDDFSEDPDETEEASRNYVSLNLDSTTETTEEVSEADDFTPLTDMAEDVVEETCEEFFDEDDASDEEPAIQDN